ncbi:hypothetical protein GCM10010399_72550 [Dactylosporangium fulvum]|uniref:Secreted protein n=1 Tax=Dactylosporangium fulvum TaxID=53359 RepID=A0ABY5VWG9_9ACTN|nr:hypothetical protein [Dactylosporangium fulvum]UWP80803.1 hypothetical protein Dfulv_37545 [Dactylosporangium fulvum]
MNSTTITIGLVVIALAVGGWILLRGGKEEEEEVESGSAPPVPRPPAQTATAGIQAAPGVPPTAAPAGIAQPMMPGTMPTPPGMMPGAQMPGAQMPGAQMSAVPAYGTGYGTPAPQSQPGYGTPPPPPGPGYSTTAPLTTEAHAYEVRARWQELQMRFVDDPQTAAGEAERLIDDALAGVTASLNARKDQLSSWRASGRDDTEQLRAAVHGYRDFLNHLVGP